MALYEKCDFHIHTHLSECARAEMTLPAIVEAAEIQGIECLGITDHIFPSTDVPAVLGGLRGSIEQVGARLRVFAGCEADVTSVGSHCVTEEMASSLDFVMVSANHFHLPWTAHPVDDDPGTVAAHYLAMFEYACSLPFVDVIAHPLIDVSGRHDMSGLEAIDNDRLVRGVRLAKKNGVAMEISPRALIDDCVGFRLRFYSLCRQEGVRFAVGSDSHALSGIGRTRMLGQMIATLGLTDDDLWLPRGRDN